MEFQHSETLRLGGCKLESSLGNLEINKTLIQNLKMKKDWGCNSA